MWNVGAQNVYFTDELKDSHMKINFTYKIFSSHMELKQFKLHVKFS